MTKKIEQEKVFGISKFALECLEILDNFERFFETEHKSHAHSQQNHLFLDGIQMIYKTTKQVLKKYGVEEMPVEENQVADFNKHNVVFVT